MDHFFTQFHTSRWRKATLLFLLLAATIAISWYRRPDQFTHPFIWVEEGAISLHDYFHHGWLSLFMPYPSYIGYFQFPSRLVFALSAQLSFRWYPEISAILAVAFQFFVVAAVAFSPTRLRHRFLCAMCVLLVPTDAEVFNVGHYANWWGSLLAILPLVWRADGGRRDTLARLFFILVGGFSSPVIVAFAPAYVLKYYFDRRKENLVDGIVACAIAATQLISILIQAVTLPGGQEVSVHAFAHLVEKFFGYFLYVQPAGTADAIAASIGVVLVLFLTGATIALRHRLDRSYFFLIAILIPEIAVICARQGIDPSIHPLNAGPRYFFYPYVTLAWIIVQLIEADKRFVRDAAMICIALMTMNFLRIPPRHQIPVDWRAHVEKCMTVENYSLPFHFDGSQTMGVTSTTTDECRYLVSHSLFDNAMSVSAKANP